MRPTVDYLIVQPYYWSPCIETAGDLAIQLKEEGYNVLFLLLDVNDPFEPPPFGFWPFYAKKSRKGLQLKKILESKKIICLDNFKIVPQKNCEHDLNFCSIKELKNYTYNGVSIGVGIFSHLVTHLSNPYPNIDLYKALLRKSISSVIEACNITSSIVKSYRIKNIIVYNGRFSVTAAIASYAQKSGLDVAYFEEASTIKKFNLFDQNPLSRPYLVELVKSFWNNAGDEKYLKSNEFFIKQRQGLQESRNYTTHQITGYVYPKEKKKRITYFSTSDDELVSLDLEDPVGKSAIFSTQREAVEFLKNWVSKKKEVELVIRVHPHVSKKSEEEIKFWNTISGENLTLIDSYSSVDSYALMESSDLVLSYSSTIGLEATYWGCPSVSLCNAVYNEFGCVYTPESLQELINFLESVPLPLSRDACLPFAYYMSSNGNRKYKYYVPTGPASGKFCGIELSMELPFVHYLKKSKFGYKLQEFRKKFILKNR